MGRTEIVHGRHERATVSGWRGTSARFDRRLLAGMTLAVAAVLLLSTPALGARTLRLDLARCDPERHRFTLDIDNPYFPLPVGQRWILTGEEDGESVGLRITVLGGTEPFYPESREVTTRVVEETEWLDADADGVIDTGEELIEVSVNWFAQTRAGTVCYFGEQVDIYEAGDVVSHEGSWRADERGNRPGIFMPARPRVGMKFQQEAAPGLAVDQAKIIGKGSATVPAGTFERTIRTRDRNPLDGSTSTKVYARGVGLIVDSPVELITYGRL